MIKILHTRYMFRWAGSVWSRSYIHVRQVGSADLRDLHMFQKVGSV